MSEPAEEGAPPFHLLLDGREIPEVAHALRLLISDEAHEPEIRRLAREVIASLETSPSENGLASVPLTPHQMKITHSAVHLLLNDLQREQASERETLRSVLEKLPDEHTMRAIILE